MFSGYDEQMINRFTKDNFYAYCDHLAGVDTDLSGIINTLGYPPFWSRTPTFSTLVHIILEQQVSLASAKAAFLRLEAAIGHITPEKLLQMSDTELRDCYFSRQKTKYVRHLSQMILGKHLDLDALINLPDDAVKEALQQVKGIGSWTADVYLMLALHRADCFPEGDVALITSVKAVKALPGGTSKSFIVQMAEQ